MFRYIFSALIFIWACTASDRSEAQEVFAEGLVAGTIFEKEHTSIRLSGSWKHFFEEEEGWKRGTFTGRVKRNAGIWDLIGGLSTLYTFDKEIDNFYEFRPWAAVGLNTPINERLLFKQVFKGELRNVFFSEEQKADITSWRTRVKGLLEYLIEENEEEGTEWFMAAGVEWYIVEDQISRERYAGTREYSGEIGRKFPNHHTLVIEYVYEEFSDLFGETDNSGHTISFRYLF